MTYYIIRNGKVVYKGGFNNMEGARKTVKTELEKYPTSLFTIVHVIEEYAMRDKLKKDAKLMDDISPVEVALFNAEGETKYPSYVRQPYNEAQVEFPLCITKGFHEYLTHVAFYRGGVLLHQQEIRPHIPLSFGVTPIIVTSNIKFE